jgi:hypothetical protein
MRILLALLFVASTQSFASEFSERSCELYSKNEKYAKALDVVAEMVTNSSRSELCSLAHLLDVHVAEKNIFNKENEKTENHVWVTLHYNEYSCQYFVRDTDFVVTQKNCYNTW